GPRLIGLGIDEVDAEKVLSALRSHILLTLAAIYLGIEILKSIFTYLTEYLLAYLAQKIMFDLRMKVFSHLQNMSLSFFDKNPVGRLVTRTINDIHTMSDFFAMGLVTIFRDFFFIIVLISYMFWLNAQLALLALSVMPLLAILTFFIKSKMRRTFGEERRKIAAINGYLQENISGMRIVQLFNREPKHFKKFTDLNDDHFDSSYLGVIYHALFVPSIRIFSGIALCLIIYYGGGQVVQNLIEVGLLYTFYEYTRRFFEPIRDLADKYTLFLRAMASAERIFTILDTKEAIKDPATPRTLTNMQGEVEFRNVTFSYDNQRDVTKNMSFKIKPGESVAFVGITGAGKSTLINLLCRFYDVNEGRITIDGIDIRTVNQADLRKNLGIVLQDVFLFSGNIINNIRLRDDNITLEQVEEVATYVNAHTFIEKLPGQYYAPVEERGSTLSTGQRQLLSFARALAFDPKILILDEATASVDVQTEHYIQEAIRKLIKDRTSIIIAHRLSTIQNVDRIIVLHKGEIRENGTHQELLAKRGIYYKLFQVQYNQQLL
ncbi:MAG: ABC transporter ATP-binding protein, partial [Planctomycetes bacterium]|nr:ABC transporter ATP-binding protein [Planctomycetota bacterium]